MPLGEKAQGSDIIAGGNVVTVSDNNVPTNIYASQIAYNASGKITSMVKGNVLTTYTYNQIGNMLTNSGLGNYAYPNPGSAHPHAATSAGSYGYEYDNNGNMTRVTYNGQTDKTITWTYDNKPSSINSTSFTYDYAGKRVKKVVGALTTYYFDPLYECTGGTCSSYIFVNGIRIAKNEGGPVRYFHKDHIQSTSIESDLNGGSAQYCRYKPYGELVSCTTTEKYKFTDQEYDSELGLYNYGAREYDPLLTRFMSADSIVPDPTDPQTLNRYSYCRNNPVMYVDPSGHDFGMTILIGAAIGAGLGALSAGISSDWNPEAMLIGAAIGGVAGAAGGLTAQGVSVALKNVVMTGVMKGAIMGAAGGAVGGAVGGALSAAVYGGNMGQAVLMGAGIGAAIGGIMGAIGGSFEGNQNAPTIQKMYTENPAFTRASWDGLKIDFGMFQGAEPDPNAFSACTRPLGGKGGMGMVATEITGKSHMFLYDGPSGEGWGLVPKNGFGFMDWHLDIWVPGRIQPETLQGATGCRFITNDPARMANMRALISEARRTFQWYNHPSRNCYWWVDDISSRSLSMPRGL